MAHMMKISGNANVYGLMVIHNDRDKEDPEYQRERGNANIDPERSKDNYNLIDREDPYQYYKDRHETLEKERLEQTGQHLRKDAVRACSLIVYLPEEKGNRGEEYERNFFSGCVDYVKDQFGEKNIIQAIVHKDETRPHIHILAIPCTRDPDRQGRVYERVSYKDAFNRQDYKEMHPKLQEYCRARTHDRELKVYDEEREKYQTMSKADYIRTQEEKRAKEHEKELQRQDKERLEKAKEHIPEVKANIFGKVDKAEVERFREDMARLAISSSRQIERAEAERDEARDERNDRASMREADLMTRWYQAAEVARDLQQQVKEMARDKRTMDWLREKAPDKAKEWEKRAEREEREKERDRVHNHRNDRDYDR